jgi:N-acetylneuraminic acid mutarotase
MHVKRAAHTATLLKDGRIFLTGGILKAEGIEENNSSTEFYNPATNSFSEGPRMSIKRAGHTATLLSNGNVLITGGFNSEGFVSSAELFNANTGKFEAINGMLSEPRAAHTATLLHDERVVILGGANGGVKANQHIDVYDPAMNSIRKINSLITSRTGHTATLLNDGRVLITGGSENWRSNVLNTCEVFDPATNTVSPIANLHLVRNKHAAVKLQDGKVLIIAGSDDAEAIGGRYNRRTL